MLLLQPDGFKLENVPVIVQPGQAVGTIGLALGYGRAALKEEMMVGLNAILYIKDFNDVQSVLLKADGEHEFVCSRSKNIMGRGDIIKETLEILILKMLSLE
jgi:molybdopterin-containing oxidoreductase family iron-sulfur binding subunit